MAFQAWGTYMNYPLTTAVTTNTYPAYPSYTYGTEPNPGYPKKKDTILDWLEKEVEKICALSRQAA